MASIIQMLEGASITYEYMDEAEQQLVINAPIHMIVGVFVRYGWFPVSSSKVEGGMYCSGLAFTLQRGTYKIRLLSTTYFRTTLWDA